MGRRRKGEPPRYRLHRQSGQAVVSLPLGNARYHNVLLGPFDTEEGKQEYANDPQLAHPHLGPRRWAPPAPGFRLLLAGGLQGRPQRRDVLAAAGPLRVESGAGQPPP